MKKPWTDVVVLLASRPSGLGRAAATAEAGGGDPSGEGVMRDAPTPRVFPWQQRATLYARLALGAGFLSGIADRFGLWRGRNVGYGDFAHFVQYTAKVNAFMPASTIPFLAWAATLAELSLGLALVLGLWLRWVALASALLLVLFGVAMAVSFGLKSPLDYSVFSASAAAVLLAQRSPPGPRG